MNEEPQAALGKVRTGKKKNIVPIIAIALVLVVAAVGATIWLKGIPAFGEKGDNFSQTTEQILASDQKQSFSAVKVGKITATEELIDSDEVDDYSTRIIHLESKTKEPFIAVVSYDNKKVHDE